MKSIIAGEGFLPIETIKEILKHQNHCNVITFENFTYNFDTLLTKEEFIKIKIFQIKFKISFEILDILKKINCNQVIFCGKVHYFGLKSILPNLKDFLKMIKLNNLKKFLQLRRILKNIRNKSNKGDDFLLSLLVAFFEINKIKVISVNEILHDILCNKNDIRKNNNFFEQDLKDGIFGIDILNKISDLDIGQSIIVQNGRVIGIEASEGTDELIKRCVFYIKKNLDKKAVFCKSSKINQNMKIDIATIGCDTLENIYQNNYSSIVLKDEKVLIVNKGNFLKLLDKYKINLIII